LATFNLHCAAVSQSCFSVRPKLLYRFPVVLHWNDKKISIGNREYNQRPFFIRKF